MCCSPWSCKESDMTEQLNWTELTSSMVSLKSQRTPLSLQASLLNVLINSHSYLLRDERSSPNSKLLSELMTSFLPNIKWGLYQMAESLTPHESICIPQIPCPICPWLLRESLTTQDPFLLSSIHLRVFSGYFSLLFTSVLSSLKISFFHPTASSNSHLSEDLP